jgi:hypothetical protein
LDFRIPPLKFVGELVERTANRFLVLPLDQFVFAELTNEDKGQKLRLVFATHEILISGHVLQRIETAIHRLELSGLMKLPEKYHSLIPENQPKVREIVVTESKTDNSQSQPKASLKDCKRHSDRKRHAICLLTGVLPVLS